MTTALPVVPAVYRYRVPASRKHISRPAIFHCGAMRSDCCYITVFEAHDGILMYRTISARRSNVVTLAEWMKRKQRLTAEKVTL